MKYQCLALDHDDTFVCSTPSVNYPSFLLTLNRLRPGQTMAFDAFQRYCYEPGFYGLCRDILGYSDAEIAREFEAWKRYVAAHVPDVCPGMPELARRQKKEGGLLCVVSHSCRENILRDYQKYAGVTPDLIFGWEAGENRRKPDPWPLYEIMRVYALKPGDILVVDDLKPGLEMARSAGCDFAAAGWGHALPEIAEDMKKQCALYLPSPRALYRLQFGGDEKE